MEGANKDLFKTLLIIGPLVFLAVIFAVLYFLTDLGLLVSALIAIAVAALDYLALKLLMGRLAGPGE